MGTSSYFGIFKLFFHNSIRRVTRSLYKWNTDNCDYNFFFSLKSDLIQQNKFWKQVSRHTENKTSFVLTLSSDPSSNAKKSHSVFGRGLLMKLTARDTLGNIWFCNDSSSHKLLSIAFVLYGLFSSSLNGSAGTWNKFTN